MTTVYLETTIPSYLAGRPSRDLITAAHQQITHDWWSTAGTKFDLFVSELVLEEIRSGDPETAARRLEIVQRLPVLAFNDEVRTLARLYATRLGLPPRASADALHIGFAVAYELDYLVTWNCKHLANGHVMHRLVELNREIEKNVPIMVTPEELD